MQASWIDALEWSWKPSVLVGLVFFSLAYALLVGPLRRMYYWERPVSARKQVAFYLGVLAVFIALCSPLDKLGDKYLFSAHMVQHMLLTFVGPPLWLVGSPVWLLERMFPPKIPRRALLALISPLPAFIVFNGVVWFWHVPRFYNATLVNESIHIIEHLSFMASAVIGWAPVMVSAPFNRLAPPSRALYLFLSSFSCTALAAMMTFSTRVLYSFYASAPRLFASLTAISDQWIGGLVMWLAGDMILVSIILVIVYRWLGSSERTAGVSSRL